MVTSDAGDCCFCFTELMDQSVTGNLAIWETVSYYPFTTQKSGEAIDLVAKIEKRVRWMISVSWEY